MNDQTNTSTSTLKKFTRKIENFQCAACEKMMTGNGYTNHCSSCLFSKHVDIFPGDRLESCQGLMRPIALTSHKKKGLMIIHQCLRCLVNKKNKISDQDDQQTLNFLPRV